MTALDYPRDATARGGYEYVIALLVVAHFLVAIGAYVVDVGFFGRAPQVMAVVLTVLVLLRLRRVEAWCFFFIMLFPAVAILNNLFHQQLTFTGLQPFFLFGVAVAAYQSARCFPSLIIKSILLLSFLFSFLVAVAIWGLGVQANDVLGQSRNHIAIIAYGLWSLGFVLAWSLGLGRRYFFYIAISGIWVSLLLISATGRVGFALGCVVIVVVSMSAVALKSTTKKILYAFVGLGVGVVMVPYLWSISLSVPRLIGSGFETPRWVIWREFFSSLEAADIFFGVEVGRSLTLTGFSLHNSYLVVFANNGILGVVLLSVACVVAMLVAFRKSVAVGLVLMGILISGFFDTSFSGHFIGVALYLFVYVLVFRSAAGHSVGNSRIPKGAWSR